MREGPLAEIARLTLREVAAGIRDGAFSAEALARNLLRRIDAHEARIRAWAWLDRERLLHQARRADAEMREGRLLGPLHGTPLGIKDVVSTRGIPTQMGSPIFQDCVPEHSASCVERLELAGAIVQGKTVTTEFAAQHPGPTANPWNVACTPGGSSSGSAAAVASGFTPGAVGTQTRGSIIRPAAYCGIVGYKPSFGRVSRHGVYALSRSLDHVGVLARTVDDAALLAAVMLGEDPRDPDTLPAGDLPVRLRALSPLDRPPRLAAVRSPAWHLAESAQRALFHENCAALRARGAQVEEVELPAAFAQAGKVTREIQLFEIAHNFAELKRSAGDRMSPTFLDLCARGERISSEQYQAALDTRDALREEFERWIAGIDAVVTLPAAGEAPQTLTSTGDAAFCSIWTLCGLPCVAIPTGTGPRSLPMGLQVVGARLADARTVEVARWCEHVLPFNSALPF